MNRVLHSRYQMMLDCWVDEPDDRPSFSQLVSRLNNIGGKVDMIIMLNHQREMAFTAAAVKSTGFHDEGHFLNMSE